MKYPSSQVSRRLVFLSLLVGYASDVCAQPAGMLYDPEPPSDSAYVRVIHASRDGAIDVDVDGQSRIKKLATGDASDYLVLGAGKRSLAIYSAGQKKPIFTTSVDVIRGQPMTLALTAMKAEAAPIIFVDKVNSNKLKALLTFYHIDQKAGKLDVLSADGNTKVFSEVSFGSSASIQVNPIAIDLIATKSGGKASLAGAALAMTQGGNYSMILLPGDGKNAVLRAIQNKTERYTGK